MNRRNFLNYSLRSGLWIATVNLVGCGKPGASSATETQDTTATSMRDEQTVILYDTYAMALYMDGGLGPKTGVIKVDYLLKNSEVTLEFWHGHGGKNHRFTLTQEHFIQFKQKKKVFVETTVVDSHKHKLFIDFSDAKWRVPGATPIPVPIDTPVMTAER